MKNIRIAICDDSLMDRDIIKSFICEYLDKNNMLADIDEYENGEDLLKLNKIYDLAFLDIYMPTMNGIELATKLNEIGNKTKIVFVSASKDFVEESYELNALRYFIKPVCYEKIELVLNNFLAKYTSKMSLALKVGRTIESFYISNIIYFESFGHKSILHTVNKNLEISENFSTACEYLKDSFIKISRYCLVNPVYISYITKDSIVLTNDEVLSISRGTKDYLKSQLDALISK